MGAGVPGGSVINLGGAGFEFFQLPPGFRKALGLRGLFDLLASDLEDGKIGSAGWVAIKTLSRFFK